jgi:dimethylargininase
VNATGTLRRVLLRPPNPHELANWREYGWRTEPDPAAIAREHAELCAFISGTGAEVTLAAEPVPGDPDAIYAYDPVLIVPEGAILLRLGKPGRLAEGEALVPALAAAGAPIVTRMEAPATADGGDMFWLDERTLLIGRGYRTNDAGVAAIRALLPDTDVIAFDLPHLRGRAEVLHLMSLVSPLDEDLVVAYTPLLPVRLVELFEQRGIEIVDVPDEEFETMGPNVLALAPRVGLALTRNKVTCHLLQRSGVWMHASEGVHRSQGDGGPTCLTRPLRRE